MVQTPYERAKAATCRIEAGGKTGTGYLVSKTLIVTCWHVVDNLAIGNAATVTFSGKDSPAPAELTEKIDKHNDIAVLQLAQPIDGIEPLALGRAADRKTVWEGYGYPYLANGQGLPIDGTIDDPCDKDPDTVDSIVLTADKLRAGMASQPHGFSGSAVVVGGYVVGHLKRILEDNEFQGRTAFGTVYAAPAVNIAATLGLTDPLPEARAAGPAAPSPAAKPGEYDVFLSASNADLAHAAAIAQALRDQGLRIYFPVADYVPGPSFDDAVRTAIEKSRAALALVTPRWLQDSRRQADQLWKRRTESPVVPVLIDGGVLQAPWDGLVAIDLRGRGPSGPAFERLLYALKGQPAPYDVVEKDLGELFKPTAQPRITNANARRLIAIGNPQRALEILTLSPSTDLETLQLKALALSKTGETDGAIEILTQLQKDGHLDGETGGILGGCYRRKYDKTKNRLWLERSRDAYSTAFDKTGDSYPGINAASIQLRLGQTSEAQSIASRVLEAVDKRQESADQWTLATRAEALLILGKVDDAAKEYRRAVSHDIDLVQDFAVMRRSARTALESLGRSRSELDAVFPIPRPVAFVGHGLDLPGSRERFPPRAVASARAAIRAALDRRGSSLGIASATVGGDTIFLDAILDRDGTARVLLPCPVQHFLERFVVRTDRQYEVRKLLQHPRSEVIVVESPTDAADLWSDFAPRLREQAEAWGNALDETPMLLTLWDRQPSFLETVIEQWHERDWTVEIIELKAGAVVA
jgi:hypothetical protein